MTELIGQRIEPTVSLMVVTLILSILVAIPIGVVAAGRSTRIDEEKLYREIPVAMARLSKHLPLERMVQLRWPGT